MSGQVGLVIIPVLAGVSLCCSGVGAVFIDYLEQRREEQRKQLDGKTAETVLIRNLSHVTGNPRSVKAWVFLIGAALYAVIGAIAGSLQAQVLAKHVNVTDLPEGTNEAPNGLLLVIYPVIIGLSVASLVLGVRFLPYETHWKAGIIFHIAAAGCSQMFSIMYSFLTIQVGAVLFGPGATITVVRQALAYTSAVSLGVSFLGGGYVMGKSAQLMQHNKLVGSATEVAAAEVTTDPYVEEPTTTPPSTPSGTLTAAQVWKIKKLGAGLAVVQLSMGIAVSAITITGAAEVVML